MTPKQPYNVKIDPELIKALRAIKKRDGIGESEQIRRGIRLWLKSRGDEFGSADLALGDYGLMTDLELIEALKRARPDKYGERYEHVGKVKKRTVRAVTRKRS